MSANQQIAIVSGHRRSGTHLLTDTIVNNFDFQRAHVDLDNIIEQDDTQNRDKIKHTLSLHNKIVFWTHCISPKKLAIPSTHSCHDLLQPIIEKAFLLYIMRDGRDVLTSYYHMKQPDHDICTFLNYSLDPWLKNLKNWFSADCYKVRFEDLITDYQQQVDNIGNYLGLSCNALKDVRLVQGQPRDPNLFYSAREFRKGIIGDYEHLFTEQAKNIFNFRARKLMKKAGYSL